MSNDNVFQINGAKGSGGDGGSRAPGDDDQTMTIRYKKGMARNHAKLLAKINTCELNGRNPAELLPVSANCKCGEVFFFPDYMALPIFNMQCPGCRTILLEWVEKDE